MSTDKGLELLATVIDQYCECCEPRYELPYTHEELIDLLSRVKNGSVLTREEYLELKLLLYNDDDSEGNMSGDVLFTGDYIDLKNKPFIPTNIVQLRDYDSFMAELNSRLEDLSARDDSLEDSIDDNARFIAAIEVVVMDEIEKLSKIIDACKLFEGDSLDDVIKSIQGELRWIDPLREDIAKGKVLSEREFTAAYEELLLSITGTAEGLKGIIKDVIAQSIIDPGEPNTSSNKRLDSIGEALATKVDKVYGYGLSENDFTNKYKEILDTILNRNPDGSGTLMQYVTDIVSRYEIEFDSMIKAAVEQMNEFTENEIQDMKQQLQDIKDEVSVELEEAKGTVVDSVVFKAGDGPASISIGGLMKGTELENRSVREVLLEILCPFVYPSVSANIILAHPTYLYRIGDTVEIKGIQANVERGSLPINRVIFKQKSGNKYKTLGAYSGEITSFYFPDILEITHSIEDNYFMVDVEDTSGNISSCGAGIIEFVYPTFYGHLDASADFTENNIRSLYEVLKRNGEECQFSYTTQNQRMVLAIPDHYGSLVEIVDQNGYIITNSFDIKTVNLRFEVKEKVGNAYQVNKYTQPYRVYYSSPNTVQGFEVTFKF